MRGDLITWLQTSLKFLQFIIMYISIRSIRMKYRQEVETLHYSSNSNYD